MKNSKKITYLAITIVSFATLAVPVIASAEDNGQPPPSPPANTPLPNNSGQPPQQGNAGLPGVIRQRLEDVQSNYDARIQNIERNRNVRNDAMEASSGPSGSDDHGNDGRPLRQPADWNGSTTPGMNPRMMAPGAMMRDGDDNGSSTRPWNRIPVTPLLRRFASSTAFSSSTLIERMNEGRGHDKDTRLDLFAWKQNMLVMELTRALDNLKQIRTRIDTRIASDTASGHNMSVASSLLPVADAAIANAGNAITALATYLPPSATSTDAQASTTVDLDKPRAIGADAIKAVEDAKKALGDVIKAIADADRPATTTPSTIQ